MYRNSVKDFCTVKMMRIMIQNLVDPETQINENAEYIENLACRGPQLIIEIETSHVQCFGDYPTVFNTSTKCFGPSMELLAH